MRQTRVLEFRDGACSHRASSEVLPIAALLRAAALAVRRPPALPAGTAARVLGGLLKQALWRERAALLSPQPQQSHRVEGRAVRDFLSTRIPSIPRTLP